MTMEERYYELRERMDRAWDSYQGTHRPEYYEGYEKALREFEGFCTDVLIAPMDENADILKNLKGV